MAKIIKKAPTKRSQFNVCIFCGSAAGNDPAYAAQAKAVAEGLAKMGVGLVYGGASVGIMGVLADTVLAGGGRVTGVIPQALKDREVAHEKLTELRVVKTMHERKRMMYDLSDVFLTLPGGFGTLDETFEILTWAQIGIHEKPIVLVDVNGYYKGLVDFLDKAVAAGFVKPAHRGLFSLVNGAEEALRAVERKLPAR